MYAFAGHWEVEVESCLVEERLKISSVFSFYFFIFFLLSYSTWRSIENDDLWCRRSIFFDFGKLKITWNSAYILSDYMYKNTCVVSNKKNSISILVNSGRRYRHLLHCCRSVRFMNETSHHRKSRSVVSTLWDTDRRQIDDDEKIEIIHSSYTTAFVDDVWKLRRKRKKWKSCSTWQSTNKRDCDFFLTN